MNKEDKKIKAKKTSIGGQALMEGIMMRGPQITAMAVRNTKGEIIVEKSPTESANAPKIFKLPILRGIYNYIYSMKTGSKYLMRSAELSGLEELEEEMKREKEAKKAAKKAAKSGVIEQSTDEALSTGEALSAENICNESNELESNATEDVPTQCSEDSTSISGGQAETAPSENDKPADKSQSKSSPLTAIIMVLGVVLGVVLAIGLFVALPAFIYDLIKKIPAIGNETNIVLKSLYKSLFEGIIRIVLLVGYMAAIALMKDIRRTFMYHGAEHKTIFCYENGLDLTVENVRKQKKYHPRCGTSFLILMVLVSIFISFFIDPVYSLITSSPEMPTLMRVCLKLLLIPLIVGIGYELIKFAGRHDNTFTKIISAPGVWLQHITVYEPTDDMIECAIAAMKEVIPEDESDRW